MCDPPHVEDLIARNDRDATNFRRHGKLKLRELNNNGGGPSGFPCEWCPAVFARQQNFRQHNCTVNGGLWPKVKYVYKDFNTSMALNEIMYEQTAIDIFRIGFEQRFVFPGLFPPLFLPLSLRRQSDMDKWSKFGDIKGNKFLKKALKQLIETGAGCAILLHKNILVVDSNGRNIGLITANITEPKNMRLFDVRSHGDDAFEIRLKKPPRQINRQVGPLDDSTLLSYHRYTPSGGGYKYAPQM